MAPTPARRALIIGGSIGGLFAALALRRQGWDVQVFERTPMPLAGRGAGIITHPQLDRILEQLGLDPHRNVGVPIQQRITLARDGSLLGTRDCPQVATSWDRMFRLLREALPDACYTHGAELTAIDPLPDGIRARFADGRTADGALLIGADGFRSSVRRLLLGEVPPLYAGYVAWRGLLDEAAMPEPARTQLFNHFGFCLPPGEQILGYPIIGEHDELRSGHRRYNFVWYRPADETTALPGLLTDVAGHTHALSIPPPMIRPAVLHSMRTAAAELLAPAFAQVVAATPLPFLQPIYDIESPRLAFPRAVLLGDAAFVVRPHLGAGVTKAAEDAACLAATLMSEPSIDAALAHYEAERWPAGHSLLSRGRRLGAYLQAEISTPEQHRAAARHHTPEAVMAETATLDF